MKKTFLLLFVMLCSIGTYAQGNTPIKGDVNGDGVVDLADIIAVIEIMKNGGGTGGNSPYYWYVGGEKPTSASNPAANLAPSGYKTVLGGGTARYPGWRVIGNTLDNISEDNPLYNGGIYEQCINIDANFNDVDFYIAVPVEFALYDSDGKNYSNQYLFESNVTIAGHQYNIYKDHNSDVLFVIY